VRQTRVFENNTNSLKGLGKKKKKRKKVNMEKKEDHVVAEQM